MEPGNDDPTPELVIDCSGQRCPLPVIELAKRITEVAPGGVVGLVSEDPAAAHDVEAWCGMRGHDYLGATQRGSGPGPTYLVRRR